MKYSFLIIALTIVVFHSSGQTKTTNLYDLIKTALPDSSSQVNITTWQKGISISPFVKWETKLPQKQVFKGTKKTLISYRKSGTAKVLLEGKTASASNVELLSNSADGYSEVQIDTKFIEDYNIEKLFGNKNYSSTLLKKEGEAYPFLDYQIKIPGKKEAWIMVMAVHPGTMNPEEGMTLAIVVLFDYNEYLSRKS